MMHYKDIPYARPDLDEARVKLTELLGRMRRAERTEERLAILADFETFMKSLTTRLALTQIRYYTNTLDETFAADMAYLGENAPQIDAIVTEITSALLGAPDRAALEQALGAFFFAQAEARRRTTTTANEALQAEEHALGQRYTALTAQATVEFEGKTYTLSSMTRFYADPSRGRRREAMRAVNGWYENNAAELDNLFDTLVKNRTAQAKNLGFESYTDMRYATRYGYGRREIEAFRAYVLKTWVPFVREIKERQRERLGVETFRMYDSPVRFPDGNPKLKVKRRAFVDAVRGMFQDIDPEAGAYFRVLDENGMLDLFDRRGKAGFAGFCLWLSDYQSGFICGRFSGDQSDFEILTHEFGHAYASLRADRANVRFLNLDAPQEIMEMHAKSMELFTLPYADRFFDTRDARRYAIKQLEYIPYFLTSICLGDEFQHEIYDNPDMTPAQRNETYARLFRAYNPYLDESDLPFASWGSQWQDTLVIYAMPFYFIDYALAQVLALTLYRESRADFGAAWKRYLAFADAAGTMPLPALAKACGLPSPFDEKCLDGIVAFLKEELGGLQ